MGRGGKDPALQRIMSLVATCAIVLAPALLTGGVLVAPAFSTGGNVSTTSTQTTTTAKTTTATTTTAVSLASVTTTGNGASSGTHYNLNIIGVPHVKTAAMDDNNGHRIVVQLWGGQSVAEITGKDFATLSKINKIMLIPDTAVPGSFNVLDANATDSNGALFQLPLDVSAKWTVYARALGTPGGKADMTTCATQNVVDATGAITQEVICSIATLSLERKTGAVYTKFQNVTAELLSVTLNVVAGSTLATCLNMTGTVQIPLFRPCLQNYFWNYDNNGLKLLQLRFYPAG